MNFLKEFLIHSLYTKHMNSPSFSPQQKWNTSPSILMVGREKKTLEKYWIFLLKHKNVYLCEFMIVNSRSHSLQLSSLCFRRNFKMLVSHIISYIFFFISKIKSEVLICHPLEAWSHKCAKFTSRDRDNHALVKPQP